MIDNVCVFVYVFGMDVSEIQKEMKNRVSEREREREACNTTNNRP
jgi:hypothetical protein